MADEFDRAFGGGASSKNEEYWRKRLAGQGELKAPPKRSRLKRLKDTVEHTVREYGPARVIARNVAPLVETGDGSTVAERRERARQRNRAAREDYAAMDPADDVIDHLVDFAGGILGSAVSDPTTYVGGVGKNIGEKLVNMAGMSALADVGLQGLDVLEGVQDQYNPIQGAMNVAAPVVIHGAARGGKRLYDKVRGKSKDEPEAPTRGGGPAEDPIDRRIRNLDEVADHPNTPRNEAASARNMADKLRQKYGRGARSPSEARTEAPKAPTGPRAIADAAGFLRRFGTVTSTVRSPKKNRQVGGARNSHHLSGRAIDIARKRGVSHRQIERELRAQGYNIIESIDEGDHSHFAFDFGAGPRRAAVIKERTNRMVNMNGDELEAQFAKDQIDEIEAIYRTSDEQIPFFENPDGSINQKSIRELNEDVLKQEAQYKKDYDELGPQFLEANEYGMSIRDPNLKFDPTLEKAHRGEPLSNDEKVLLNSVGYVEDVRTGVWMPRDKAYELSAEHYDEKNFTDLYAKEPSASPVSVYNQEGKLVGNYRTFSEAVNLKPDHIYMRDGKRLTSDPFEMDVTPDSVAPPVVNRSKLPIPEELTSGATPVVVRRPLDTGPLDRAAPNPRPDLISDAEWRNMPDAVRAQMAKDAKMQNDKLEELIDSEFHKFLKTVDYEADQNLPPGTRNNLNDLRALEEHPDPKERLAAMERLIKAGFEIHRDIQATLRTGTVRASWYEKLKELFKRIISNESGSFRPFGRRGYRADSSGPEVPPSSTTPDPTLNKFYDAVKNAEKASPEQRKLYREERKKRIAEAMQRGRKSSGEKGLHYEKAALSGELPKKDIAPTRHLFTQDEVDDILKGLKHSRKLSPFESITARDSVAALLDGKLPTDGELALLYRVYPELVDAVLSKRSLSEKAKDYLLQAYETARGSMGSGDVSFAGRQGFMMVSRPEWWKAAIDQFKVLPPTKGKQVMDEQTERIVASPHYDRFKKAKIHLMDLGNLGSREEFAPKSLAEHKYSPTGPVVRASNRAYTYMANELRTKVAANILDKHAARGIDIDDPTYLKTLGEYINTFTGRGKLPGDWDRAMPFLNVLMFAPRFVLSTFQRLNPLLWARMARHPAILKEAARDSGAYLLTLFGVLGLADYMGYDVVWDVKSPTGLKIKHGNTTYDIGAGMVQTVALLERLRTGKRITGKGEEVDLTEGKFGQDTTTTTIGRFLRSKAHPMLGYFIDAREGKNVVGEEFSPLANTFKLFSPMYATSIGEHVEEQGVEGAAAWLPAAFGVGINTFKPPATKDSFEDAFKVPSPDEKIEDEFDKAFKQ